MGGEGGEGGVRGYPGIFHLLTAGLNRRADTIIGGGNSGVKILRLLGDGNTE